MLAWPFKWVVLEDSRVILKRFSVFCIHIVENSPFYICNRHSLQVRRLGRLFTMNQSPWF